MYRRIAAFLTAVVVAASPAAVVLAEEMTLTDETELSEEIILTDEAAPSEQIILTDEAVPSEEIILTDEEAPSEKIILMDETVPSGETGLQREPERIADDFLLAVSEFASEEEELVTESHTETLAESGLAAYAMTPQISCFANGEYIDSYGGQLADDARAVYEWMKQSYAVERGCEGFTYTLPETLTFDVPDGISEGGVMQWDKENNAEYQAAVKQIRYIVQSSYDALLYDAPEVYWIASPKYGWTISFRGSASAGYTGTISSFKVMPTEKYEGASGEIALFDEAVKRVAQELRAQLPKDARRCQIVQAIHDYLCRELVYEEGTYARSAAGVFLKDKKAVCEGYAKAFKILCAEFGIESVLIPGGAQTAGGIQGHMWNYVRMEDGAWYLVDATWDDRKTEISRTYFLAGSQSVGFRGLTLYEEREKNKYPNFSPAEITHSFAFPTLSEEMYHEWVQSEVLPTCLENAKITEHCLIDGCTAVRETELPDTALGHVFAEKVTKEPTCTQNGEKTHYCQHSGCTERWTEEILPRGHAYGRWKTIKAPTALAEGTEARSCALCSDTQERAVEKLHPTVKVNVGRLYLQVKQSTKKVKVSGLAEGDYVKSWESDRPKTVSVSSLGKITGKRAGTATVTITLASGKTAQVLVKVQKKPVKTTEITGLSSKLTLTKGKKKSLKPVIRPLTSQEKVRYTSSNKKIASVSAKGVITAKKAGKAKITVRSGKKKFTVTVTVPKRAR